MKTQTILLAILIVCLGMFLNYNCNPEAPEEGDETLSLQKRPYTGNSLKIDGYYYYDDPFGVEVYRHVYFFYANGVLLDGGFFLTQYLTTQEDRYTNGTYGLNAKREKDLWGVYQIDSSTIQFEQWEPDNSEKYIPYIIYKRFGKVFNDTTFQIIKWKRRHTTEWSVLTNEVIYHYKKFSPKPDSVNVFIP